jgi:hypothetical protein
MVLQLFILLVCLFVCLIVLGVVPEEQRGLGRSVDLKWVIGDSLFLNSAGSEFSAAHWLVVPSRCMERDLGGG